MRIRIVLDLNGKKIDVAYHSQLQGMLYNALPYSDDTKKLHDDGFKLEKRKFKMFTFSELYGPSKYDSKTKKLEFSGNACFDFTAFDSSIVKSLTEYIDQNKTFVLNNQVIQIVKYDILDDFCTVDEREAYYTTSPIIEYKTDENKKQVCVDIQSLDFKQMIINNLSEKYYLAYSSNMPSIDIVDICNVKEKVVSFRKVLYHAFHMDITFDHLTPEIKRVILTCGIGSKNSMGFGMLSKKR